MLHVCCLFILLLSTLTRIGLQCVYKSINHAMLFVHLCVSTYLLPIYPRYFGLNIRRHKISPPSSVHMYVGLCVCSALRMSLCILDPRTCGSVFNFSPCRVTLSGLRLSLRLLAYLRKYILPPAVGL